MNMLISIVRNRQRPRSHHPLHLLGHPRSRLTLRHVILHKPVVANIPPAKRHIHSALGIVIRSRTRAPTPLQHLSKPAIRRFRHHNLRRDRRTRERQVRRGIENRAGAPLGPAFHRLGRELDICVAYNDTVRKLVVTPRTENRAPDRRQLYNPSSPRHRRAQHVRKPQNTYIRTSTSYCKAKVNMPLHQRAKSL